MLKCYLPPAYLLCRLFLFLRYNYYSYICYRKPLRPHRKFLYSYYDKAIGLDYFPRSFFIDSMDYKLIKLFNCALADSPLVNDTRALQLRALKLGYIIDPQVLNRDVEEFLRGEKFDANSTFYATWGDVRAKNRLELFWDQIEHYSTTYGTDFTAGYGFVPNPDVGKEREFELDFASYKFIAKISEEELYNRCMAIICSPIALKSDTVKLLCNHILSYHKNGLAASSATFATAESFYPSEIDIESIINREALVIISDALGIRPSKPIELLRFIIYKATWQTLLIKSDALISMIINNVGKFDFNKLNQVELEKLASIFYRFKPLFLAFRNKSTCQFDPVLKKMRTEPSPNRNIINKIRRLAQKFHTPMKIGFWESVLSAECSLEEVEKRVVELSNFKIIRLMQAISERLLIADEKNFEQLYIIRNGKAFIKEVKQGGQESFREFKDYYNSLYKVLRNRLLQNIAPKACIVKFPQKLELAAPASEKNFIGNIPFGSSYATAEHNFFGIYWRDDWGAKDFDLSFISWRGIKTGWNDNYNTGDTIYSGDITSAPRGASEIIYAKGTCPDGVFYCNRYNGNEMSKFRLFFGREEIATLTENYMVNPASIEISQDILSEKRQKMLGIISAKRLFLVDLSLSDTRVSNSVSAGVTERILARKAHCFVNLKELLLAAGYKDAEQLGAEEIEAATQSGKLIDLTNLNRDTIIALLS